MKWRIVLCVLTLPLFTANAQAETLADAMEKCSQVSNSLKRLVCFDKLVQRSRGMQDVELPTMVQRSQTRPTTAPATAPQPSLQAAPQQSRESTFGFEQQIDEERREEFNSIRALVAKVDENALKRMVITLDNGQVWRQMESGSVRLKAGDEVIVERGLLGSFHLKRADSKRRIRVKRSS